MERPNAQSTVGIYRFMDYSLVMALIWRVVITQLLPSLTDFVSLVVSVIPIYSVQRILICNFLVWGREVVIYRGRTWDKTSKKTVHVVSHFYVAIDNLNHFKSLGFKIPSTKGRERVLYW